MLSLLVFEKKLSVAWHRRPPCMVTLANFDVVSFPWCPGVFAQDRNRAGRASRFETRTLDASNLSTSHEPQVTATPKPENAMCLLIPIEGGRQKDSLVHLLTFGAWIQKPWCGWTNSSGTLPSCPGQIWTVLDNKSGRWFVSPIIPEIGS